MKLTYFCQLFQRDISFHLFLSLVTLKNKWLLYIFPVNAIIVKKSHHQPLTKSIFELNVYFMEHISRL